MTLVKTSLLNGIAVLVKMITLLGLNKILALYVGPSGYAAMGQFQNAVQMITTFASGAINTGVTKYTAEHFDSPEKQRTLWRTAGTLSLGASIFTSMLIVIFNEQLAEFFLNDKKYGGVFLWFGATLTFFTLNALLLAVLNGKKEVSRYVIANIVGSCFALVVTAFMAMMKGLYGALVALAIYQSLSFIITLFISYRASWFKYSYFFGAIDRKVAMNLAKFSAMALVSALCVPISHVMVRTYLTSEFGQVSAGYWEAMFRFSSAYLIVLTSTLSVYLLPRLSELKSLREVSFEVRYVYKFVLPAVVVMGVCIYFLRGLIVSLLFSSEFSPMENLFFWQLVGDFMKVGSWVLGYVMISRAQFKGFVGCEIVFSFSFVLLTALLGSYYGLMGVVLAHALNYFVYWLVVSILVFKRNWFVQRSANVSES
ncbi:O-antigen translocase [Pseudomonas sp. SED1]|jgi:PST family polysaccharide transporter|uniref:O-antigen translocase n=1 Tax=Pseudomonas sp. SED1 TaxID=3056845 RepID=UPI00296FD7DB|nr:O-antigen translocase [Pseudomonas sp. SED1]MDY0835428.1 O-antigen translocase [Pseudomonas sp. SED1]